MSAAYIKAAEAFRENPGQLKAYNSTGHCVVLAGPGSGKTKTLTTKLARMLAEDVRSPRGIACITYSNECARELRRRLLELGVEERKRRIFIGTVHSFALQNILEPFALAAGVEITYPIKVATQEEQRKAFAEAIAEILGQSAIPGQFKVPIDAYRRTHLDRESAEWSEFPDFAQVIARYEAKLRTAGLIDFDDMMLVGLRLVRSHEWVRQSLVARFPIIAVDEYQDLGVPLHEMVMALCFNAGARLFAVGDADQSIYGFNGAKPELLRELSQREDVTPVILPFNYRCSPEIIEAGETALGERRGYSAHKPSKGLVAIHYFANGLEEQAEAVIGSLIPAALKRDPSRRLGDIAILYTDYNDGNLVSAMVASAGLEYIRIDSGAPVPTSPLIRWLQDCTQWCAGGWQVAKPKLRSLINAWLRFNPSLKRLSEGQAAQRCLIEFLFGIRNPEEPLRTWLDAIDKALLSSAFASEGTLREEEQNLQELRNLTEKGGELENATIATFSGQGGSPDHLNLITLHSAKGLEYEIVFLLGMDKGRLPSWADKTSEKLAEARRRFYVGLTRAKREVHLTYSGFTVNKAGQQFNHGPSPFLLELEKRLTK